MRTVWKVIERDVKAGRWATMYASLSPKGVIALSRRTWETTGRPAAYVVMFDEANQRIGLKPAASGEKNAYPAVKQGGDACRRINAHRLMAEQRLKLKYGLRFTEIEIDREGVLTLELRTAQVNRASVARQHRQPKMELELPAAAQEV
ncbi:MAG TPA: hypothetical protein PLK77_14950 [Pyrinomonadaceae bacterium]|nr:hypothetical protein [Pyrinomonadaceae bacterium]